MHFGCEVSQKVLSYRSFGPACLFKRNTLLRVIPTMAFNSSHLTFCLANLLAFYLAFCLRFYLAYLLAFYLAYLLTFYLAYLSGIPSGMSSDILSGISSDIQSGILSGRTSDILIWHSSLAFYLAVYLAFYLAFYLAYLLAFCGVPCRTSTARIHAQCSLPDLNRDHPRQVEVRQGTLGVDSRG